MPTSPGRFYFWQQRAAYVGPGQSASLHSHHAAQILIGLSSPIRVRTAADADWQEHRGVLVQADQTHETDLAIGSVATIWLEPGSSEAQQLATSRREPAVQGISADQLAGIVPLLQECLDEQCDAARAEASIAEVMGVLALGEPDRLDPRVERARELLGMAPGRRISWLEVAGKVALSVGRMAHLFKAQVGSSPRRYLLWLRLGDAIGELAKGKSIAVAAHSAGFSDAAHFTRTFRAMLGFTPSAALRSSKFVQDHSSATR